jgi:hypothetical protein
MPRSIYLSGEIHLIGFGKKPCPTSSFLSITLKNAGSGSKLSAPWLNVASPFTISAKPIATLKILLVSIRSNARRMNGRLGDIISITAILIYLTSHLVNLPDMLRKLDSRFPSPPQKF